MPITSDTKEVPVRIVGSSVFGRYPTISVERTYNMFITSSGDNEEEWLVNFPGYAAVLSLVDGGAEGRGVFHSVRGGFLLAVAGAAVFRINLLSEVATQIGTTISSSTTGEVFFDENLSSQIVFVDGIKAYIYNYVTSDNSISDAVYDAHGSDFQPNYVTYQNTYFIFGNALTTNAGSQWVIYEQNIASTGYSLKWVQTLTLQTKPDFAKAVIRIPGRGNNVLVLGSTVGEIWTNVGGLEVYQRVSSINIDYGCASVSTIAASEEIVAWLGINEKSSPAIMAMTGGAAKRISTDGIDHLLQTVNFPALSTAVLYRQDGHLFYIISFFDPADNFSIVYDFTTNKIYDVTDWDFTTFPARQMVYYKNKTFFISFKDGQIYEISSDLTNYDTLVNSTAQDVDTIYTIPRVRLTNTHRLTTPQKYRINMFTFTIESGTTLNASDDEVCFGYIIDEINSQVIFTEDGFPILQEGGYCITNKPRVDLTISKSGGIKFGSVVAYELKATGQWQNQPRWFNLGYAQQITYEMRFWGNGRWVVKNGMMEIGN